MDNGENWIRLKDYFEGQEWFKDKRKKGNINPDVKMTPREYCAVIGDLILQNHGDSKYLRWKDIRDGLINFLEWRGLTLEDYKGKTHITPETLKSRIQDSKGLTKSIRKINDFVSERLGEELILKDEKAGRYTLRYFSLRYIGEDEDIHSEEIWFWDAKNLVRKNLEKIRDISKLYAVRRLAIEEEYKKRLQHDRFVVISGGYLSGKKALAGALCYECTIKDWTEVNTKYHVFWYKFDKDVPGEISSDIDWSPDARKAAIQSEIEAFKKRLGKELGLSDDEISSIVSLPKKDLFQKLIEELTEFTKNLVPRKESEFKGYGKLPDDRLLNKAKNLVSLLKSKGVLFCLVNADSGVRQDRKVLTLLKYLKEQGVPTIFTTVDTKVIKISGLTLTTRLGAFTKNEVKQLLDLRNVPYDNEVLELLEEKSDFNPFLVFLFSRAFTITKKPTIEAIKEYLENKYKDNIEEELGKSVFDDIPTWDRYVLGTIACLEKNHDLDIHGLISIISQVIATKDTRGKREVTERISERIDWLIKYDILSLTGEHVSISRPFESLAKKFINVNRPKGVELYVKGMERNTVRIVCEIIGNYYRENKDYFNALLYYTRARNYAVFEPVKAKGRKIEDFLDDCLRGGIDKCKLPKAIERLEDFIKKMGPDESKYHIKAYTAMMYKRVGKPKKGEKLIKEMMEEDINDAKNPENLKKLADKFQSYSPTFKKS